MKSIYFNNYVNVLVIIYFTLFTACRNNSELKMVDNENINVELAMTVEQEASFVEIFNNMQYIPLETGDNCLLDGRAAIKCIHDDDIFIESERRLYRFRRDGKFVNCIGKNGQGPEEYSYPGFVSIDSEAELIYLFNNKRFQVWTFDNKFIKEIAIDDSREPVMGSVLDDKHLITEFREYLDNGGVCSTLAWLDHSGRVVHEELLYKDDTKMNLGMWSSPNHAQLKERHILKEEWSTTIYAINNVEYERFYTLNLGELAPSRKSLQDVNERDLLYQNYAVIDKFWFSKKYFWITLFYKEMMYEIMIDMHKGTLFHSRRYSKKPESGFGIVNPKVSGMVFWPEFIDVVGSAYMLLQPSKLTTEGRNSLNKICHNGIRVDEISNPILVYVK